MGPMINWPFAMVTIDQPRVKDLFQVRQDGRRVLPSFSLAERDRRYARIRRHMQREGLECLIAAAGEPFEPQASSRYLTQIGGLQGAAWATATWCPSSRAEAHAAHR